MMWIEDLEFGVSFQIGLACLMVDVNLDMNIAASTKLKMSRCCE